MSALSSKVLRSSRGRASSLRLQNAAGTLELPLVSSLRMGSRSIELAPTHATRLHSPAASTHTFVTCTSSSTRHLITAPSVRHFSTSRSNMGVKVQSQQPGDGTTYPKPGDKLTMHYTGTLEDGKKFDSSVDRGQPFAVTIGVGQVIKGWDEGIVQMSLGEKAKLTISGDYAYGQRGYPGLIPPNATLIFDVHLLSVNGKKAA